MDPMMAAIKKKRAGMVGDHDMGHDAQHVDDPHMNKPPAGHGSGLHEFVAGLNDQQKSDLKSILDKSGSGASEIQKGGPSTHEKQLIAKEAQAENESNQMEQAEHEQGPDYDEDEIASSMLDHNSKNAAPGQKPRNLGERMRFGLASKLKTKGKI